MASRLRDRLSQQAAHSFVGRVEELETLQHCLNPHGPSVIYVHGIGGIGKSSLLAMFAGQLRTHGVSVVQLDCRTIEPSERGFLQELGAAIGGELPTPEEAAERLGGLSNQVVLALDTYEVYRLMDAWLRQVFLPNLPDHVRVFIFGREAPVAAWAVTPGWQGLFRSIRLEALRDAEAIELLLRNGVNQEDAARVNRFARGHPLALKLAAAAIAERPNLRLEDLASRHIVAELTNLYLADVRDPLTREALDAASVVRRTTLSLLGAMLPDVNALDAYERLSALPFTEHGRDGLILADTVQQAIAAALRAADPSRYRALRRAAWRQLRQESRMAGSQDLWRYTADMLYLIEQPVIREAFFPSQSYPLTVETAWLEDGPAIHAISHRHEGPTAASLLDYWWQQLPNSFRTVRDHRGVTIGYYCMFVPTTVEPAILRHDPLIWKWWQHLQSAPVPEKQTVLFARRWLAQDEGESPSAVQAACWLDIKASYMSLRAVLRRIYCTARHTEVYAPILQQLGFQLLPQAQVELDNTLYHTAMLDFGPDLFLGWLSGHIDTELGSDPDQLLDVAGRALRIDGNQVPLTPLEFKVMRYLMDREGQAVTRIALLADVWGYEYQGGSNIVDAVIRTLRKKLAEHASRIETVSGVGYRFRGQ